ncbi:hypothetical protein SteCoe_12952 [Stentor coeruleus]|uniref:Zinc/iron permease n=1 Tax=Stentor coeruleus TaxID=5963 RepID=A0A1R2C9J4_9CILI|nr:hypothetical protein SteCoe_12952 [Stentor coeruleus]
MNDITAIKVIFIFVMFVSAGIAGAVPIFSKSFRDNKKLISTGNCFAAGIFLLVGIVHLLRDSQEAFVEAIGEDLPIGYVVSLGGYTLILFIENVMFNHNHDMDEHDHHDHNHEIKEEPKNNESNNENLTKVENNLAIVITSGNVITNKDADVDSDPNTGEIVSVSHKENKNLPGIILTVALVVHSIFEGIAGGLLNSKTSVISVCVAILIHNVPAAVALGIKLENATRKLSILLMLLFITSSPLGMAIGISLSDLQFPIIKAIFLSISAGTFLYIGCTEIIAEEMHKKEYKYLKFFGFLLGFVPLAFASIFIKD